MNKSAGFSVLGLFVVILMIGGGGYYLHTTGKIDLSKYLPLTVENVPTQESVGDQNLPPIVPAQAVQGTQVESNLSVAQCLSSKGVVLYGTHWCPHCQAQRDLFGETAKDLPYVECSLPNSYTQTERCIQDRVMSYPLWRFPDGTEVSGKKTVEEIAQKAGCEIATAAAPVSTETQNTFTATPSPLKGEAYLKNKVYTYDLSGVPVNATFIRFEKCPTIAGQCPRFTLASSQGNLTVWSYRKMATQLISADAKATFEAFNTAYGITAEAIGDSNAYYLNLKPSHNVFEVLAAYKNSGIVSFISPEWYYEGLQ